MLSRLYAVVDLEVDPVSLDHWYGAAFPASWLCGFAASPLWGRWSVPAQRQEKPHHSLIAER
jgi:hypothetical protein